MSQITFDKLASLDNANYDKIKSVLDYDLLEVNKFLDLEVWEAFNVTGDEVDILVVWRIANGYLVILSVVGNGLKNVMHQMQEVVIKNGLKGIEIETHKLSLVRLYKRLGFNLTRYKMRL